MANSPADIAGLLTHVGCSATIAQNTKAKADEVLATVVGILTDKGITVTSTSNDPKRNKSSVMLSNDNLITVRWMEE